MRNDFESNYLMHHGILGQKWGIRRYQNPDGSLTPAGRERYGVKEGGSVNDISSSEGSKKRVKDLKKAIKINEKKRGKEYTKIANNPENFLGLNKGRAKKISEYTDNIKKGEDEIKRLMDKMNSKPTDGAEIPDSKIWSVSGLEKKYKKNGELSREDYKHWSEGAIKSLEIGNPGFEKWLTDQDPDLTNFNPGNKKEWESKFKKEHSSVTSLSDGFGKYTVDKQYAHLYEDNEVKNISRTEQKLGGEKVNFEINNYNYSTKGPDEPQEKAVARAQNFLKNFNVNDAKEEIAKEYYDNWKDDYKERGISRAEFKAAIKPYSVDIDKHEAYVAFDDGGMVGYHSLDLGVDPETMKIRYHTMNG